MRVSLPVRQLQRSQTIGFIGLGAMGSHMAANLLSKTFEGQEGVYLPGKAKPAFVVYDAFTPAVDKFLNAHTRAYAGRDIIPSSSPAGVARLCSTIFTMLPSSNEVKSVYLGELGLREGLEGISDEARAETLLVDCTTLDREVAVQVAGQMEEMGAAMIDAPVSGGVVGAEQGTLALMCGGPKEAFERAEALLKMMGQRVVHCGASGTGLAVKIANNLLLGIQMAGTAEAMLLGKSMGVDSRLLASIINSSSGQNWACTKNNPAPASGSPVNSPADRDYAPGFMTKLMAKDLRLAMQAGQATGVPLPVGTLTNTLYNKLEEYDEFKEKDFSVVYEYLRLAAETGQLKKT